MKVFPVHIKPAYEEALRPALIRIDNTIGDPSFSPGVVTDRDNGFFDNLRQIIKHLLPYTESNPKKKIFDYVRQVHAHCTLSLF